MNAREGTRLPSASDSHIPGYWAHTGPPPTIPFLNLAHPVTTLGELGSPFLSQNKTHKLSCRPSACSQSCGLDQFRHRIFRSVLESARPFAISMLHYITT